MSMKAKLARYSLSMACVTFLNGSTGSGHSNSCMQLLGYRTCHYYHYNIALLRRGRETKCQHLETSAEIKVS